MNVTLNERLPQLHSNVAVGSRELQVFGRGAVGMLHALCMPSLLHIATLPGNR